MRIPGVSIQLGLVTLLAAGWPASQAWAQNTSATPARRDHVRSLWIDSTRITVTIGERRAILAVATPVGRFRVTADSSTLAGWADSAVKLGAPRPDEGGAFQYNGIMLRQGNRPDAMRLMRITADSAPDYQFDVSNGGWGHAFRVRAAAAESLFAALRGELAEREPDERMAQEEVLFEFQVDEPAVVRPRGPTPKYPAALEEAQIGGRVLMQFIVGPDGAARPASLTVLESTHPEFTRAVRETVLSMRFQPARRKGVAVATFVQQRFEFRIR